jgi:hypothetical protein
LHDDGRRVVYTGAIVQAFSEKFKRLFDYVYGIDWLALRGTDAGRGTEQSVGNVFHSVLPGFLPTLFIARMTRRACANGRNWRKSRQIRQDA